MAGTPTRRRSSRRAERRTTRSARLPASRLPTSLWPVEGAGGVHGDRGQRLLQGQAHAEAGDGHREGQRRREAAAGVGVGGERHRRRRRRSGRARARSGPGAGRRRRRAAGWPRSAASARARIPSSETKTRWSAERAPQLGRQLRAARPASSSAWTRSLRPRSRRRGQDAPALLDREHALLAEDVAEDGEAPARPPPGSSPRPGGPRSAPRSRAVLGRDLVGAQERGHDADGVAPRPRRGSPPASGSRPRSRGRSRS